jgi:uncharacterized membrane protein HdeD (DUF308 family)
MSRPISLPQWTSGIRWTTSAAEVDARRRSTHCAARPHLPLVLGARGGLAVLFAASTLVWPDITWFGLALGFGAYLLVDGATRIAGTLAHDRDDEHPRWAYLLSGSAGLLTGLMTWFGPQKTGLALAVLASVWALTTGLVELTAGVLSLLEAAWPRRRRASEWLLAISGGLSIVAGLAVLLWPDAHAAALATVLGGYALLAGAVLLAGAWQLRGTQWSTRAESSR